MKSQVEDFLTAAEEEEIIQAIITAESKTSGEIRVHLEASSELPTLERAKALFHLLKMDNTKAGTGVLFYVAVATKSFAVLGDHGINSKVPVDFWETIKETLQNNFKNAHFAEGLITGIHMAGDMLQKYFPWHPEDKNELSDEISKG